jgi:hypothetical protein
MPNTADETTFYRNRVQNHISRSSHRHSRPVICAYLTRATDEDIQYWGKQFRSCERVNQNGKVRFRL